MSTPRRKIAESTNIGNYFARQDKGLAFVSSGCALLDCVLGGGYVLGRITNIAGDKSTGKTLLAIEASANFLQAYPEGVIRYAEAEAAFDQQYAEALGMPVQSVQFADNVFTVEDFFEDVEETLKKVGDHPCVYILDSLDALSDRAEQKRKIDEGSYGAEKAKKMGELFRRLVQKIENSRMLLVIISQIRDKIGVTFGKTTMRSGGRALDFYASQCLWLAEVEKLKRTIGGHERVTGIRVRAKAEKNKIGLPYRECEFPVLFGYGVDDLTANVEWLLKAGKQEGLATVNLTERNYKTRLSYLRDSGGTEVLALRDHLRRITLQVWEEIETEFLPRSRKY